MRTLLVQTFFAAAVWVPGGVGTAKGGGQLGGNGARQVGEAERQKEAVPAVPHPGGGSHRGGHPSDGVID